MTLKNDLSTKKPILGLQVNLKRLRSNKISKLYVSSNCSGKERIAALTKLANIEVIFLDEKSKDLGVLCKKPFAISVVGFE
ncbi:MAG TPA: ribosomal L7Ae/L30e/S12e/Gadd45 family protein [Candidatus Nanoarchaeia archaeon]|nr:ribosomal L7Ae/L30e/S12e/Gadd45 family protein [Candidatus Nanoarchaeia archaeon]